MDWCVPPPGRRRQRPANRSADPQRTLTPFVGPAAGSMPARRDLLVAGTNAREVARPRTSGGPPPGSEPCGEPTRRHTQQTRRPASSPPGATSRVAPVVLDVPAVRHPGALSLPRAAAGQLLHHGGRRERSGVERLGVPREVERVETTPAPPASARPGWLVLAVHNPVPPATYTTSRRAVPLARYRPRRCRGRARRLDLAREFVHAASISVESFTSHSRTARAREHDGVVEESAEARRRVLPGRRGGESRPPGHAVGRDRESHPGTGRNRARPPSGRRSTTPSASR